MPGENAYSQPFPVTLAAVRKGALVNELTEKLAEVVAAVMQFEKPGELKLVLKVKPENAEMVIISDELTVKAPEADRPPTWFFATDDGGLTRDRPEDDLPLIRQVKQNAEEQQ
jgi:hypothetical protein